MGLIDKMMEEIAKNSSNWRYYCQIAEGITEYCGLNEKDHYWVVGDSMEDILTKIWLHYYGSKIYRLQENYFRAEELKSIRI